MYKIHFPLQSLLLAFQKDEVLLSCYYEILTPVITVY